MVSSSSHYGASCTYIMTSLATSYESWLLVIKRNKDLDKYRRTYPLEILEGKADTVLHPDLITDSALFAQDGDGLDLDAVLDDASSMTGDGGGSAFHTSPGTHTAIPANDGVQNACIVLNLGILQHDRLLDTDTSTDDGTGANGHIRTKLGCGVHLGCGVDVDWGDDIGGGGSELLRAALQRLLEIECVGGDGRASSLDLAPEVFGLIYKEVLGIGHIAQNVLLEADDLVLLALVVIIEHERALEVLGRGV